MPLDGNDAVRRGLPTPPKLRTIRSPRRRGDLRWTSGTGGTATTNGGRPATTRLAAHRPGRQAPRAAAGQAGNMDPGYVAGRRGRSRPNVPSTYPRRVISEGPEVERGGVGQVAPEKTAPGALVARMDEKNGYRGWDCWVKTVASPCTLSTNRPTSRSRPSTRDPIKGDKWIHLVATYNGSGRADGVKIYVDGQIQPMPAGRQAPGFDPHHGAAVVGAGTTASGSTACWCRTCGFTAGPFRRPSSSRCAWARGRLAGRQAGCRPYGRREERTVRVLACQP